MKKALYVKRHFIKNDCSVTTKTAFIQMYNFPDQQSEKFATIEGPIQPNYQYTVPKEFGNEPFRCDFNKKWYLPAAGIPSFELDIYRGRQLQ